MSEIFILLVVFQIKHWLADYPLQGRYMLGKFKSGWDFVPPLAAHSGVHALFTFLIAAAFCHLHVAASLAAVDFGAHFIIDRIKASPRLLGRYRTDQPQFWGALGADQMAHHLCHYAFIWAILSS